jgi:DNA (cytosine-5)-methyltransferase 1
MQKQGKAHNKILSAVDVFAGCGGLSEGFTSAGFEVAGYLERDKWACETIRTRIMFYKLRTSRRLSLYHGYIKGEISREEVRNKFPEISDQIECAVIEKEFGRHDYSQIISSIRVALKAQGIEQVNVLLGGPPCQAYSLVGRSRDPDRMEKDRRHFLYQHYLSALEDLQPDFFVLENVPGLLTARVGGEDIFQKMLADFAAIEPPYDIAPSYDEYIKNPRGYLINSAKFRVPQRRSRVLLIGYRRDLGLKNPRVRQVFLSLKKKENPTVLDVDDAIGDLPGLKPGEGNDKWFGPYPDGCELKQYQLDMRTHSIGICNHKARTHMESDLERYKFFIEHHLDGEKRATLTDLVQERPDLRPDHRNLDKFIDRFKVQWWTRPSATVMAHIAKDGHYYIHPDVHQCRSFTVREAARCQSFPDNFFFEGPRTEQLKQVGNAVPPRMAEAVARTLGHTLREIYRVG